MKKKNINNTDKKYEYDYGNKARCIFSHLYGFWINFAIVFSLNTFMWIAVLYFFNTIIDGNKLPDFLMSILSGIFIIITFASFGYIIVCAFLHKCVVLKNTNIVIIKNRISPHPTRGQVEAIPYYLIRTCEYEKDWQAKVPFNDYSVSLFNWESIAKITTISNKEYYIPLKNVDDFIAEVNERRKRFQMNLDDTNTVN